ncbi:hypothetical protein HPB50_019708 [Hyalomma asiaticum]|uniref:Uncharacterized protein n=1 Tax=Hyalomma asiaticum TaxID=266040 RepID=A0ACB7S8H4_HYAAI|nr:hypothetical protein HPB50_019708 [Hyalomma asiaticum]
MCGTSNAVGRLQRPSNLGESGFAQKGVQIIKRLLKKAGYSREEFWLELLSCRAFPLEDGVSPAQHLKGGNCRTPLPELCLNSPQQLSNPENTSKISTEDFSSLSFSPETRFGSGLETSGPPKLKYWTSWPPGLTQR